VSADIHRLVGRVRKRSLGLETTLLHTFRTSGTRSRIGVYNGDKHYKTQHNCSEANDVLLRKLHSIYIGLETKNGAIEFSVKNLFFPVGM
jgi:hypothetical protein